MERWVCALTGVAADGNVTQLYPAWAATATAPASATNGQQIRNPTSGILWQLQVKTDGANAGVIELYDINGIERGIDVSSAAVITDTQLDAAIAAGDAKLIYSQNFIATPETPFNLGVAAFQKGLAARFVAAAGACTLNLTVDGGYRYTTKVG